MGWTFKYIQRRGRELSSDVIVSYSHHKAVDKQALNQARIFLIDVLVKQMKKFINYLEPVIVSYSLFKMSKETLQMFYMSITCSISPKVIFNHMNPWIFICQQCADGEVVPLTYLDIYYIYIYIIYIMFVW